MTSLPVLNAKVQRPRSVATASKAASPAQGFSARVRMLPILVILSYLSLTVFLFAVGPWQYPVTNPFQLYLFLFLAHAALFLGYWRGSRRQPGGYSGKWTVRKVVLWSALVNVILVLPTSWTRTGSWIPDVLYGLRNPGAAYANARILIETGNLTVEYIRVLAGPLLVPVLPLTVFYWQRLPWRLRLIALTGILGLLAISIAMGRNRILGEVIFSLPILAVSSFLARQTRFSRKVLIGIGVATVFTVLFFVSYFGSATSDREGSYVWHAYLRAANTKADYRNFLIKDLSEANATAVQGLDLYFTQGYYALSLALQEPFIPMWGIGNSEFLTRQVMRITGNQRLEDMSYPARIERYGWDSEGLWNSTYPWIASDVSFPGTILVVFFIGRLLAVSWLDTIRGANPFAIVMFYQVWLMLLFFPAANIPVQSGEGFTAFWGILILWLWTRRNRRPRSYGLRSA